MDSDNPARLPATFGQVDGRPFTAPLPGETPRAEHRKLQERVTEQIARINGSGPLPLMRHFTITRSGADMRVACWCSKARVLETQFPNRFARQLDDFLFDHEECLPKAAL
jgi:hypothetical protein